MLNEAKARLDAMDAALWAVPVHSPQTRPHIGAVLHCEGVAPGLDAIKAELAKRLPKSAALRSRLHRRGKHWDIAPTVDLEPRVSEEVLEPGPDSVDRAVRRLLIEPLPATGPHWRLHLLHGHEPGRYALFYRVHHALNDGAGMIRALEVLFGDEDSASSANYPFAEPSTVTLGETRRTIGALAYAMRRKGIWAPAEVEFSSRRTLDWAHVPAEDLRTAGRRHGGTANDAYLAALGHALAEWAAERFTPAIAEPPVTLLIPANVRRTTDLDAPGNRIALATVEVPGGTLTADERLEATTRTTVGLKSPQRREALRRIAAGAPAWLMTRTLAALRSPARTGALASNLVLRRRLHVLGDPVARVDPVMWTPEGVPMTALLITYDGTTSVCFTADASIPGLDGVHERWLRTVRAGAVGA